MNVACAEGAVRCKMRSARESGGSKWVEYSTPDSKYYVNRETKEKVYEMPLELATPEERVEILAKREKQREFFNVMEENITRRLTSASAAARSTASTLTNTSDLYAESKGDEVLSIPAGCKAESIFSDPDLTDKFFDFNKPGTGLRRMGSLNNQSASPLHSASGIRARTISSLDLTSIGQSDDAAVLTEVNKLLGISTIAQYSPDAKSELPDFLKERKLSFDILREKCDGNEANGNNGTGRGGGYGKEKEKESLKKKRRNSTGTIYITATLAKQDNEATIRCVCSVLHAYITEAAQTRRKCSREYWFFLDNPQEVPVSPAAARERNFSEDWIVGTPPVGKWTDRPSPMGSMSPPKGLTVDSEDVDLSKVPTIDSIILFFQCIFRTSQLESECIIIALIYCDRLMKESSGGFVLRHDNWRSTVFLSLVMASKVWDDLSMWNSDFSQIVPGYDLERLNKLELRMLEALKYDMKVPAGQYAKYYFILRSLIAQLGIKGSTEKEERSKVSSLDLAQLREDAVSKQKTLYDLRRARDGLAHHMSVPNLNSLSSLSRESLVAQANEGKKKGGDRLPDHFMAHLFNSVPTHADGTVVSNRAYPKERSSMEVIPMAQTHK